MKKFLLPMAVLAATLAACNSKPPVLTSVTVKTTATALKLNEAVPFTAEALDEKGAVISGKSFSWSSSSPEVATVDANGLVTAKRYGNVTISAKSDEIGGSSAALATYGLQVLGGTNNSTDTVLMYRFRSANEQKPAGQISLSIAGPSGWNAGQAFKVSRDIPSGAFGDWLQMSWFAGKAITPVTGAYKATATVAGETFEASFSLDASQKLPNPTLLKVAKVTASSVDGNWAAVTGAGSYAVDVYNGTDSKGEASSQTTSTNATLNTNFLGGKKYYYQIHALSQDVKAPLSTALSGQFNVSFSRTPFNVVTSMADSGVGSLRDTMTTADAGTVLTITQPGTVNLNTALAVTKNLTLTAAEGMNVTLDAGGKDRAMVVKAGATLSLKNIVLRGGKTLVPPMMTTAATAITAKAGQFDLYEPEIAATQRSVTAQADPPEPVGSGGVLYITGNASLGSGVVVENGEATSGGGIFVADDATLNIDGAIIRNNKAIGGGGIVINNKATFNLTNGIIEKNTSEVNSGGVRNRGKMTMLSGEIRDNTVKIEGGHGGGIYNTGDFLMKSGKVSNNTVAFFGAGLSSFNLTNLPPAKNTIEGGSFEGNKTTRTNDAAGGAIWSAAELIITGGNFSKNSSLYGAAITAQDGAKMTLSNFVAEENSATLDGGAIGCFSGSICIMKSGIIRNNTAIGVGGAITLSLTGSDKRTNFILEGGLIEKNTAKRGGGIRVSNSDLIIKGGEIKNNTASEVGGGIQLDGSAKVTIEGGVISNNDATKFDGGAVNFGGEGAVTITGGTISGNTAGRNGGGIYGDGLVTMSNGVIESNTAKKNGGGLHVSNLTMTGGLIRKNSSGDIGGGVAHPVGVLNLRGGIISENKTVNAGGGVATYLSKVELSGVIIENNVSGSSAGGFYPHGSSNGKVVEVIMSGGAIRNNTGKFQGGVLLCEGTMKMTGGQINGNTATNEGSSGGIGICSKAVFSLENGEVSNNNGHGVGTDENSKLNISGGKISGNKGRSGGGVEGNGQITMTGGSIESNEASEGGGAIFIGGPSTFDFKGGEIKNNTSKKSGGGIFAGGIINFSNGLISNNTAKDDGGGVAMFKNGILNMSGGSITNNKAATGGGVRLFDGTSKLNKTGGTISGNMPNDIFPTP
jgi:hypothetical protein